MKPQLFHTPAGTAQKCSRDSQAWSSAMQAEVQDIVVQAFNSTFSPYLLLLVSFFPHKIHISTPAISGFSLRGEQESAASWREPVLWEISIFSEGENGWKEEILTRDGKENPCYSSYIAALVQSLLDEKLNLTFVLLPRSASAAPAAQTCLGPALPHTAKKCHIKSLKTSRKGGQIEEFGPVLHNCHFSLLFHPSAGNP